MRNRRPEFTRLVVIGLALGWAGIVAANGVTPADRCEERKLKAAGKKANCLLKEAAKEVLGQTPDVAECSEQFLENFTKAEAKAGPGVCPTEGDAAAIEAQVDACVGDIAAALSGSPPAPCAHFPATGQTTSYTLGDDGDIQAGATLSYTDNGNGTITDNNTGLMWEKKSDDGSLHDKDTVYTWANAFAVHVAGLNAGSGFAGHTDWRLPNVKELQSIVNYQNVAPAVSSAFNTGCVADCTVLTCSCTVAGTYWSSSTSAFNPAFAWGVSFSNGTVFALDKGNGTFVRAVRGGL